MAVTFSCPCGESLVAEEIHAGCQVECPNCDRLLTVPRPKPAPKREYAEDGTTSSRSSTAPAPPPRKKSQVVDDEDDDYDRPRRKKKRNTVNPTVRRLMDKAHEDLDAEEDRRRQQSGGLAIHPGIIQGIISIILGFLVLIVAFISPCGFFYILIISGVLILGGIVRIVLGFLGQGTD
jgi:small-conductance mechanosensitive channel